MNDPLEAIHEQHRKNLRRIKITEYLMYGSIVLVVVLPILISIVLVR